MYGPILFLRNVAQQFPGSPHVRAMQNALSSSATKTPRQRYNSVESAVMKLMMAGTTPNSSRKLVSAWHRYQAWHRIHGDKVFAAQKNRAASLANVPLNVLESKIAPLLQRRNMAALTLASKRAGMVDGLARKTSALHAELRRVTECAMSIANLMRRAWVQTRRVWSRARSMGNDYRDQQLQKLTQRQQAAVIRRIKQYKVHLDTLSNRVCTFHSAHFNVDVRVPSVLSILEYTTSADVDMYSRLSRSWFWLRMDYKGGKRIEGHAITKDDRLIDAVSQVARRFGSVTWDIEDPENDEEEE